MHDTDQEMRSRATRYESVWDNSVDERNTARLKEIITEIGWPTISKVGEEASLVLGQFQNTWRYWNKNITFEPDF